jgi:CRISPR system Cascade subunit CasE
MSDPLYLHRIVLADPLAVQHLARDLRLPDHPFDPDYVLHCLLSELFGPGKVQPFVQDPRSRGQAYLGYSFEDSDTLQGQAQAVAPPDIYNMLSWRESQSKALPVSWKTGARIGFRTRVCPLVRGPSGHGRNNSAIKKSKPEVDAYLARCWREDTPPSREDVYREWLEKELHRSNAVEMESARMEAFRLKRALRRTRDRKAKSITRPDALFKGVLRIKDPEGFRHLLARGLGRHRAFGFGMILLTAEKE